MVKAQNEILDKNNMYPEEVVFNQHYSVFLIAFKHRVNWSSLNSKACQQSYTKLLHEKGWRVHDYLVGEGEVRKDVRRFQPESIMTPHAHEVLFGETLFNGDLASEEDTSNFISDRLNPDMGTVGQSESLMFSMQSSELLGKPLTISDSSLHHPIEYGCQIDWVDLFLYNDGTGMLAFKAQSLADKNGIDSLSLMNRTLRDYKNGNLQVCQKGESTPQSFWHDVVLKQWLAVGEDAIEESWFSKLSADEDTEAKGLLLIDAEHPETVFDRFQKHCKTLVVAQMPGIQDDELGMRWGRPLSDPPVYYADKHYQALNEGAWDATLAASQKAVGAGYATVRDMVVFELATVSSEQASLGWKGGRGWQYGLEYIRKVVDNNFIEIWEYWAGIALRDSCVFVSYDKAMPIIWQAESYYYPLYVLAYHNRFRLDCMSQSIIDYDMADALNGREVRDEFQRFRNQYWFQDVTVDFQGVEVYQQIQHGMGLNEQYESVSSEISDVSDHLQEKWERGTRVLFAGLAVMLAPVMDFWNTWALPKLKAMPTDILLQYVGGAVLGLLLLSLIWLKFRKPIMAQIRKNMRRFHRYVGKMGNK